MNRYEHGNLALKGNLAPELYPYTSPGPLPLPDYETERRNRERRLHRLQYENSIYLNYKQGTRARSRHLFSLVLVVIAAVAVLGISVLRYAKITELNFSNVRLNREIKELEIENSLIQNAIINKINLDEIRENARTEAGLQQVSPQQIVQLDFSVSDKVVYTTGSASEMEYDFAVDTVIDWVMDQRQSQP